MRHCTSRTAHVKGVALDLRISIRWCRFCGLNGVHLKRIVAAIIALAMLAVAPVLHARGHKKYLASDYTHTAIFATYLWTATPADRHKLVRWSGSGPTPNSPPCEYWDDGYETEITCPNLQATRRVDTKLLAYVRLDGGKPLLVDGPKREGTTPCRVVLNEKHQITEVFVPVLNKKGDVKREVRYTVR